MTILTHRLFKGSAILAASLLLSVFAYAADPPDTLTLADGEKLIGHLVRSMAGSVTFHSDSAGDITIPWAKIKDFTASGRYAVIPGGVTFRRSDIDSKVKRGTLTLADQKVQVVTTAGQPAQTVPVGDIGYIIDEAGYQKALHNPGFAEDWKGAVSAGVSLIEATQKAETFSGSVHLVRAIPVEDWLAARYKTIVDFTASYGKVDQPSTPEVKTDLLHFGIEQDESFSPRTYALEQAAFDHNFSQGLTLQQTYSGGIGHSVLRSDKQTLDLKATMAYINQKFTVGPTKSLVGSVFGETYHRNISSTVKFDEQLTFIPAYNHPSDYSWNAGAGITMLLRKRFNLNISTLDTFLNDPPPGFKKNSFTFTTGISYALP